MSSTVVGRPHVKEFGLSEVYTANNPLVDVVFVHGLNGSAYETWTTKKSDIFWPADLLPKTLPAQQLRILTYGYNANVTAFLDGTSKDKIHNHAEHLAAHLFANRNLNGAVERPIIFICHSLGGLIVKKCLSVCSRVQHEHIQHLRSIYISAYAILFLGTPHNGSDIAKFGSLLQSICSAVMPKKIFDTSPQLINSLKTDNEHLQIINRDFAQIMSKFRIYFFHESKPMDLKSTRAFIVDESSAAPLIDGVERMGIEADHGGMCRFEDNNSPGYEAVAEAVLRYSTDAPKVIPGRWIQEHKERLFERQEEAKRLYGLTDAPVGSLVSLRLEKLESLSNSVTALLPSPPSESGDIPRSQDPEKDRFIRVVPPGFHPNSTFFGMEKELEELHTRLYMAKKRTAGTVAVLLYGGPGAGKSHLARQYMYTYQSLYPGGVFWIDCRTRESRYNGIWQIAQMADEQIAQKDSQDPNWRSTGVYVETVRKWLESRENWLLVFDDISFEHSSEINEFKNVLPFTKNTAIIYTSIDRTLSKKQRLLEPYGLEVKRLALPAACKMLFKDLGIKNPTPEQEKKATELVKYYQCLPLAIHAIGHRLRASGRALEKYHFDSHLTDERLAEPYRDIMRDLFNYEHYEALNLIKILSFFGHHVPVGMLVLGRKALLDYSVEIRTSDRGGSNQRHLDNTITVLIKYGLIERTLYLYYLSDMGDSGTMGGSRMSSDADDSHVSDNDFSAAARSTIDTIKIHTVVQGFCRDELKDQGENHYYWWLALATALFCLSYDNAKAHMRATRGSGLARDYREYLTHARRLMSHFPTKLTKVAISLQNLHDTLSKLTADMESEIADRSPGSSQESFRNNKSIFDRTSSMSSVPDTPNSQISSLSWGVGLDHTKSESPVDIYFPQQLAPSVNNPSFHIPIITEDVDCAKSFEEGSQVTEMSRAPSQATATPQVTLNDGDETGWQVVEKKPRRGFFSVLNQWRKTRNRKNLGNFRPKPTVSVTQVNVEAKDSPIHTPSIHSVDGRSYAESALAAVQRSSPPIPGGRKPIGRSGSQKENRPSYADVVANQPMPLAGRSTSSLNQPPPPFIPRPNPFQDGFGIHRDNSLAPRPTRDRYDALSQSTHSDPGVPRVVHHQPSNSATDSQTSARSEDFTQYTYTNRDSYGSQPGFGPNPLPLPFQSNVSVTRRSERNSVPNLSSMPPPSLAVSGFPQHRASFSTAHMPTGYSSQPLSRDHSGRSNQSLRTEPARFPPAFSGAYSSPLAFENASQMPQLDTRRAQHVVFGSRESVIESSGTSPSSYDAPTMSRIPSGPGMMVNSTDGTSRSLVEFRPVSDTHHIQFGETHPVNVDAARRRARAPAPYPAQNLIPTASDPSQLQMLLSQNPSQVPSRPVSSRQRRRSGSSPVSRQDLRGFGLQFQ
ncbi:hypothetical protein LOZ57_003055 [Ophidiomyces ophidiicola]|uniref:uncharacterized protein n=1 Tax=Ophidiomyces ophidiicola TaxID=1387563 RepID=UPI0020C58B4A|nr:uncharacterized protein LOZ57_003055 [Ophidiomyces ophidiicola]KAI1947903.1 hypothetical protein LOZ57_003055 [Ophidiomyces ophidiicola]